MASFTGKDRDQMLAEAEDVQGKTKDAITRIKQQTAESEAIGTATLEELRKQGEQMDEVNNEVDGICDKLDKASTLQNQFDRWAGNWLGGKKRAAQKEAATENANRVANAQVKVQEVFEHSKYDSLSRKWRYNGLYLTTVEMTPAPDLFDPALQATIPDTRWTIDFSIPEIDAEGWTYGYDFSTINKG